MAGYTYDSLVTELQKEFRDFDEDYSGSIDNVIYLSEQRIAKDIDFDAMHEEVTGVLTANDETFALPTDAIAIRHLRVASVGGSDYKALKFRMLGYLRDAFPETTPAARPDFMGIFDEDTYILAPKPLLAYPYKCEFDFRITGLSATTQSTWISTNQGPLLFYACCLQSSVLSKTPDDEKRYGTLYNDEKSKCEAEINRRRTNANSALR